MIFASMKVLFVASGNKKGAGQVNSFVQSQYDSLKAEGLEMVLFPVVGHGAMAHLRAAWQLRKIVRREKPDVIHAHYSIYGYVAAIACFGLSKRPKIVVSLLGSFPRRDKKWRLVRFCVQHVWSRTLVKSKRTKRQLGMDVPVIPNGVNLDRFHPMDKAECRKQLGRNIDAERLESTNLDAAHLEETKYVIWCSNPERIEKNWKLAEDAVHLLESEILDPKGFSVKLVPVFNKTPDLVATYMNAADCLLLTSWSEGSPNVIKEAMACNCPIVTIDVGDVNERLEGLDGCLVATIEHPVVNEETQRLYGKENAEALAKCLAKVLETPMRTKGYERIVEDGLTIELTAKKIIKLYNECI